MGSAVCKTQIHSQRGVIKPLGVTARPIADTSPYLVRKKRSVTTENVTRNSLKPTPKTTGTTTVAPALQSSNAPKTGGSESTPLPPVLSTPDDFTIESKCPVGLKRSTASRKNERCPTKNHEKTTRHIIVPSSVPEVGKVNKISKSSCESGRPPMSNISDTTGEPFVVRSIIQKNCLVTEGSPLSLEKRNVNTLQPSMDNRGGSDMFSQADSVEHKNVKRAASLSPAHQNEDLGAVAPLDFSGVSTPWNRRSHGSLWQGKNADSKVGRRRSRQRRVTWNPLEEMVTRDEDNEPEDTTDADEEAAAKGVGEMRLSDLETSEGKLFQKRLSVTRCRSRPILAADLPHYRQLAKKALEDNLMLFHFSVPKFH